MSAIVAADKPVLLDRKIIIYAVAPTDDTLDGSSHSLISGKLQPRRNALGKGWSRSSPEPPVGRDYQSPFSQGIPKPRTNERRTQKVLLNIQSIVAKRRSYIISVARRIMATSSERYHRGRFICGDALYRGQFRRAERYHSTDYSYWPPQNRVLVATTLANSNFNHSLKCVRRRSSKGPPPCKERKLRMPQFSGFTPSGFGTFWLTALEGRFPPGASCTQHAAGPCSEISRVPLQERLFRATMYIWPAKGRHGSAR